MSNGWDQSAAAWIADQQGGGDFSRRHVMDAPMLARIRARQIGTALDLGCGEGRFCRMMQGLGIATTGIDPTEALLTEARRRDPQGHYIRAGAEDLPFPDAHFDLVVSYLTFIDIQGIDAAITQSARVLKPGAIFLIANLTSFASAGGWTDEEPRRFTMDGYLRERDSWAEWRGIRIRNWHRPLSRYMQLLLAAGLNLTHFDEPAPLPADHPRAERYRRAPWLMLMEWQKPRL